MNIIQLLLSGGSIQATVKIFIEFNGHGLLIRHFIRDYTKLTWGGGHVSFFDARIFGCPGRPEVLKMLYAQ